MISFRSELGGVYSVQCLSPDLALLQPDPPESGHELISDHYTPSMSAPEPPMNQLLEELSKIDCRNLDHEVSDISRKLKGRGSYGAVYTGTYKGVWTVIFSCCPVELTCPNALPGHCLCQSTVWN